MDKFLTTPIGATGYQAACLCGIDPKKQMQLVKPAVDVKKVDKKGEKKFDVKR